MNESSKIKRFFFNYWIIFFDVISWIAIILAFNFDHPGPCTGAMAFLTFFSLFIIALLLLIPYIIGVKKGEKAKIRTIILHLTIWAAPFILAFLGAI